ncbi:hypothetical protein CKO31_06485 [Thiohalocapsa halophila]|uniref:Signaling pathway modulator ZraP n=1 Tax=Thiohalocapsa halophila TaxID=69359 RepID=A0ABS1CFZ1_9GAMM|nr:periplasmic heavy metal sensor [Thiohalocapsa halophila]MBK1630399.1 hypothetical protein [Thiohalocapsa halophila]
MLNAKTQLTALAIAIALAGGAATAAPLEGHPRAEQRLDMRMERMAERLDLSAAQRTEIRAILDDHHQAADMHRARLREQIDAVLTAEQRMRRDEQRAYLRGMREGRGNRGAGGRSGRGW